MRAKIAWYRVRISCEVRMLCWPAKILTPTPSHQIRPYLQIRRVASESGNPRFEITVHFAG